MHPTKNELSEFLQGKLPGEACDSIVSHLESCPPCQETIRALEPAQDTLLEGLKNAPPPTPSEPECDRAISQAAARMQGAERAALSMPVEPSATQGVTRERFVTLMLDTGIVSAEQWQSIEQQAQVAQAVDAAALARVLVQQNVLTKLQAAGLFQNKTRGLVFGEYVVLDRIGAGGMGQVFKARHRRMDRLVALKVMSPSAMKNADAVKRFEREVRAAAKLAHSNIVHAYDAGQQDGMHYLVMEFVDGPDLSNVLKKQGVFAPLQAAKCILQAARALAFAHSKGVVHRDIKPGNMLIDRDGTVKLLDLGLARMDDPLGGPGNDGLTQSGQMMGTVDYMAPEQAFNTREAGPPADVYSLGCSIYRLVTGESVYPGESSVEKILAHREKPIPSLSQGRPQVSAALNSLFQRMVAKQPGDRPAMTQIVSELEAIVSGAPVLNAPVILRDELSLQASGRVQASLPKSAVVAGHRSPPRKNRRLLVGAGAAGFLFLLLGIWLIIRDKDGNELARVKVPDEATVEMKVDTPTQKATPALSPAPSQKAVARSPAPVTIDPSTVVKTAPSKSTPVVTSSTPSDPRTIDLLKLIDPEKHAHMGTFKIENGELITTDGPFGALELPVQPAASYRIELLAKRATGKDDLSLGLVVDGVDTRLLWEGYLRRHTGLHYVNGERVDKPGNITQINDPVFRAAGPTKIEVEVTPKSVRCVCDGKTFVDWRGSASALVSPEKVEPHPLVGKLWLGCFKSEFRISKLTYTPLDTAPPSLASGSIPPLAVAPFDAAQARAHQEAWAKHLGVPVETTNSVGAKMVLIPPGEFLMGSSDEQVDEAVQAAKETKADAGSISSLQSNERPQHRVIITKPFLIGMTEVTVGQFKKFAASGYVSEAEKAAQADSKIPTYLNPGFASTDESPAAALSWNDATAYCEWLSKQENTVYRLPTEAEWEYCCRAGTTTQYSFGNGHAELEKHGWYNKNAGNQTHAVGTRLPNAFGVFDMHGNVGEWCVDYYLTKAYESAALKDPQQGPAIGSYRVLRGGHWALNATYARSAFRTHFAPSTVNARFGFRVVRAASAIATSAN